MLALTEKRKPSSSPVAAIRSDIVDVLTVHSDEHVRNFLVFHLKRAGYRVRLAEHEIRAWMRVMERAPDVMIMDVDLQGMHCFEFLAGIRADSRIPFFPVLFLTTHMDVAHRARELGAASVLKPVRPEKLLATVAWSKLIRRPHRGQYH